MVYKLSYIKSSVELYKKFWSNVIFVLQQKYISFCLFFFQFKEGNTVDSNNADYNENCKKLVQAFLDDSIEYFEMKKKRKSGIKRVPKNKKIRPVDMTAYKNMLAKKKENSA